MGFLPKDGQSRLYTSPINHAGLSIQKNIGIVA